MLPTASFAAPRWRRMTGIPPVGRQKERHELRGRWRVDTGSVREEQVDDVR